MKIVKLRAEFSKLHHNGKSHRDIYHDAIAQGHPEKLVKMLVGQIPHREQSHKYKVNRYVIMTFLSLSAIMMLLVAVLGLVGEVHPLITGAYLVEALITGSLGYLVFRNYYIAYLLLIILSAINIFNKITPALDGDTLVMGNLALSVVIIILAGVMLTNQFTHCTLSGKPKIAEGEDSGFWE